MYADCVCDPDEAPHQPLRELADDSCLQKMTPQMHSIQEEVHSFLAMKLHPMTPDAGAIAPIHMVLLCSKKLHTCPSGALQ